MTKLVNSNVGWESSFPVYVLMLPKLSALGVAWLVWLQLKQEMSSLNLNFSLHAVWWPSGYNLILFFMCIELDPRSRPTPPLTCSLWPTRGPLCSSSRREWFSTIAVIRYWRRQGRSEHYAVQALLLIVTLYRACPLTVTPVRPPPPMTVIFFWSKKLIWSY